MTGWDSNKNGTIDDNSEVMGYEASMAAMKELAGEDGKISIQEYVNAGGVVVINGKAYNGEEALLALTKLNNPDFDKLSDKEKEKYMNRTLFDVSEYKESGEVDDVVDLKGEEVGFLDFKQTFKSDEQIAKEFGFDSAEGADKKEEQVEYLNDGKLVQDGNLTPEGVSTVKDTLKKSAEDLGLTEDQIDKMDEETIQKYFSIDKKGNLALKNIDYWKHGEAKGKADCPWNFATEVFEFKNLQNTDKLFNALFGESVKALSGHWNANLNRSTGIKVEAATKTEAEQEVSVRSQEELTSILNDKSLAGKDHQLTDEELSIIVNTNKIGYLIEYSALSDDEKFRALSLTSEQDATAFSSYYHPERRETALALIKEKAEQYPDEVVKILSNISLVDTQTSGEDSKYLANFLSNYMNNNPDDKCAAALAKQFNTAMVGWGKDKDFVIAVYNNMSESAREAVRNAYQEKYGKSLTALIGNQAGLSRQLKSAPEATKSQTEVAANNKGAEATNNTEKTDSTETATQTEAVAETPQQTEAPKAKAPYADYEWVKTLTNGHSDQVNVYKQGDKYFLYDNGQYPEVYTDDNAETFYFLVDDKKCFI